MKVAVRIADDRADEVKAACDGNDRWLWAGYSICEETILLVGDDDAEPSYGTKITRVTDAISHETMHAVLHQELGREYSAMYDDLIRNVVPGAVYLHYYAIL